MPRKVFVAGEILTAADVNTNLMDQSVMVFDDATARTTAIPTPVEGMVTYLSDVNQVQAFTGSAFTAVGGILQVLETQITTSFTTTTAAFLPVTGLEVTITPSSSTSKVLVLLHGLQVDNSVTNGTTSMKVARDSTEIGQVGVFQSPGPLVAGNISVVILDSPATSSAVTYKGLVFRSAGISSVRRSAITVMEVAG